MKKQIQTGTIFTLFAALLLAGFGTVQAQTEISDWNDLNDIRNNLTGSYILVNDIDEQSAGYSTHNTGDGWLPIGDTDNRFAGTFDGDGFTISGLMIDRDTGNNGLFGATQNATLMNVGLIDVDISAGAGNNGALAGNLLITNVSNAWATGEVRSTTSANTANFGGLLGRFQGGLIEDSWAAVDVDSGPMCNNAGGLMGYLVDDAERPAQLRRSFATGNVIGNRDRTAGLVGANNGTITDSYARGNVIGSSDRAAGLVGWNIVDKTIGRSYSTGSVEGSPTTGGLVAFNEGTVSESYWDTETSGESESEGGTGKTSEEMKDQATFDGWSFTSVWAIDEDLNDGYPVLMYQLPTSSEAGPQIPQEVVLNQNYPNPFNPSTVISYSLTESQHVRLSVHDVTGRLINVLVDQQQAPGEYQVNWDAGQLSSGVYIYRIQAGSHTITRHMTFLK
ncbi:MAG: T9SS type A sorting domain-containing protein [Cyclonatronaceae bacterium]